MEASREGRRPLPRGLFALARLADAASAPGFFLVPIGVVSSSSSVSPTAGSAPAAELVFDEDRALEWVRAIRGTLRGAAFTSGGEDDGEDCPSSSLSVRSRSAADPFCARTDAPTALGAFVVHRLLACAAAPRDREFDTDAAWKIRCESDAVGDRALRVTALQTLAELLIPAASFSSSSAAAPAADDVCSSGGGSVGAHPPPPGTPRSPPAFPTAGFARAVLPGVAKALSRTLLGPFSQGHRVFVEAAGLLSSLLKCTLGDAVVSHLLPAADRPAAAADAAAAESPAAAAAAVLRGLATTASARPPGAGSSLPAPAPPVDDSPDARWFAMARSRISEVLSTLFDGRRADPVALHHPKVAVAFAKAAAAILSECFVSLAPASGTLLDHLAASLVHEHEGIRGAAVAALSRILGERPFFRFELAARLADAARRFPGLALVGDWREAGTAVRRMLGYLELLPNADVAHFVRSSIELLSRGFACLLAFDCAACVAAAGPDGFPLKVFRLFLDGSIVPLVCALCRVLVAAEPLLVVDHLLGVLRTPGPTAPQTVFVLNLCIETLPEPQRTQTSALVLASYFGEPLWLLPTAGQGASVELCNSNALSVALVLEGVGAVARTLSFVPWLPERLFSLAEKLGDPAPCVREAAAAALTLVAHGCGCSTAAELLGANLDYLVDPLRFRLRRLDEFPNTARAMREMLSAVGDRADILTLLEDTLDSLFAVFAVQQASLTGCSPQLVAFLRVLETIVGFIGTVGGRKEDAGETDGGAEADAAAGDGVSAGDVPGDAPAEPTLLFRILENCQHFLSAPDRAARLSALAVLLAGLPKMCTVDPGRLRRVVHLVWLPLRARFSDSDRAVRTNAFKLVALMARLTGTFVAPKFEAACLGPLLATLGEEFRPDRRAYPSLFSPRFVLLLQALETAGAAARHSRCDSDAVRRLFSAASGFLGENQPEELRAAAADLVHACAACDADLVFYLLLEASDVPLVPHAGPFKPVSFATGEGLDASDAAGHSSSSSAAYRAAAASLLLHRLALEEDEEARGGGRAAGDVSWRPAGAVDHPELAEVPAAGEGQRKVSRDSANASNAGSSVSE